MINKKLKNKIGILMLLTMTVCASMSVSASSYVSGTIGGANCNGTIRFESGSDAKRIIARTNCDLSSATCVTVLSGAFKIRDQVLTDERVEGSRIATLSNKYATGYQYGNAKHTVYYGSKRWSGGSYI